MQKRRSSTF